MEERREGGRKERGLELEEEGRAGGWDVRRKVKGNRDGGSEGGRDGGREEVIKRRAGWQEEGRQGGSEGGKEREGTHVILMSHNACGCHPCRHKYDVKEILANKLDGARNQRDCK